MFYFVSFLIICILAYKISELLYTSLLSKVQQPVFSNFVLAKHILCLSWLVPLLPMLTLKTENKIWIMIKYRVKHRVII